MFNNYFEKKLKTYLSLSISLKGNVSQAINIFKLLHYSDYTRIRQAFMSLDIPDRFQYNYNFSFIDLIKLMQITTVKQTKAKLIFKKRISRYFTVYLSYIQFFISY